ncbi:MFS transporter [Radiobacillus deserti]|uniref:MFS transporter n=1 Tax=Radiobacillus deserti TaxID=2594883 RepID=A0A516KIB4_9BACI|nr:MFS transporter [Radiobacillus deserti]QDP41147.1 MFS transporter [Radiobacillus deserti]
MKKWRYLLTLLVAIGVSNIGSWIYFIALNLIVLNKTGSAFAVSILYLIKPLATMTTNLWAGSLVDRMNKKKLMIFLDFFRALGVAILPFMPTMILLYVVVFIINMASSVFEPTSMSYITKLIPIEKRKSFNSLHSLVTSGGFLIGPGIAGLLFLAGSPTSAIFINALALLISGLLTIFIPNVEKEALLSLPTTMKSGKVWWEDWKLVLGFSFNHKYIMLVYLLFGCVMTVMASAIDSLEAAFSKEVLSLTDSEYGMLVSIAGAGVIIGAIVNAFFVEKIKTNLLIGLGTVLVSTGYLIYAFSNTFLVAAIGFFFLAFFLAFANTGFLTFYQNNIPAEMMGRIRSIYNLLEAIFIIVLTSLVGVGTHLLTIRNTVIISVMAMMILSLILLSVSFFPSKKAVYIEI